MKTLTLIALILLPLMGVVLTFLPNITDTFSSWTKNNDSNELDQFKTKIRIDSVLYFIATLLFFISILWLCVIGIIYIIK